MTVPYFIPELVEIKDRFTRVLLTSVPLLLLLLLLLLLSSALHHPTPFSTLHQSNLWRAKKQSYWCRRR